MTYANHYTGGITITPPLKRREISGFLSGPHILTDVELRIKRSQIESEDGEEVTTRMTADAIIPFSMAYSGHQIPTDVMAVIDHFPDHEFGGYIEVQWDPGFRDPAPTRYMIEKRTLVEVRPTLVWPGDTHRDIQDVLMVAEACAELGNEEGPRSIRHLYAWFKDSIEDMNGKGGK